jgi:lysophospholipase L1-like esterase
MPSGVFRPSAAVSPVAMLSIVAAALALSHRPAAAQVAPGAAASAPAPLSPAPVPRGGSDVPTAPQIAFPGQYAPPSPDRLRPSNPKACRNLEGEAHRLACFQNVAFDWPGLGRFAAANAELAAPARGERRVVFLGDSITDNWSRQTFGGFFPGKPYINRGIGGQTSGQMLARFRQDVLALHPRAVVILAGTNDVSGNVGPLEPEVIQGYLTSLCELARQSGIKVVLASLLPVRDGVTDAAGKPIIRTGDRPPAKLVALNRWMADYARRNRHIYLDYHGAMADETGALKPELTYDGLHPNARGYAVMAPLAEAALVKAIGK